MEKERAFLTEELPAAARRSLRGKSEVRQKSAFDIVTDVDLALEEELKKVLSARFPADTICGEETSSEADFLRGRVWTLDPIDGTYNFAGGLPLYGVQAALLSDGEILCSAVFFPAFSDLYYAERGRGCTKNGAPMSVKRREICHSLVSFGDYPHRRKDIAARQHGAVAALMGKIAKVRMFGAASVDFSALASGGTDGAVVFTKNVWDLAPGILLAREAGALLSNEDGGPYRWGDEGVIACASEELFVLVKEALRV